MDQLNLNDVAAWVVNSDGETCIISERFADLLGVHSQEMLGNRWTEWIHPDDHDDHVECWRLAFMLRRQFLSVFRMWNGSKYLRLVTIGEPFYRDEAFAGYVGLVQEMDFSQHQKSTDYARPA